METALGISVQDGAGIGHGAELVDAGLELGHGSKRVRGEEETGDVCWTTYIYTQSHTFGLHIVLFSVRILF